MLMRERHLKKTSELEHPATQNVGTALTAWDQMQQVDHPQVDSDAAIWQQQGISRQHSTTAQLNSLCVSCVCQHCWAAAFDCA